MGKLSNVKCCLFGCLIIVLVLVASSIFIPNRLTSTVKWLANNDFAGKIRELSGQEARRANTMTEMVVETIGINKIDYVPVVILKEKGGELYLPIWIGPLEANAIAVMLEEVEVPRPLTPDLLCSIIDRMGASVDYIVINDLQDNVFYANIILNADWMQMEIDARPSDAIAIALRVKAPIYVAKAVLEKAGVQPEDKRDRYTVTHVKTHRWGQLQDASSINLYKETKAKLFRGNGV